MFEQWFKFWRDWMFWWLPGGDTPADQRPGEPARQQSPSTDADGGKPADRAAQSAADAPVASAAAPSSAAQGGSDDLTAIKGIGPAIARKLQAAGVRSFADLAAADPNELADKIASRPVTAERVRTWISEARTRT
jgi:large subunit ribosomal protein L21